MELMVQLDHKMNLKKREGILNVDWKSKNMIKDMMMMRKMKMIMRQIQNMTMMMKRMNKFMVRF